MMKKWYVRFLVVTAVWFAVLASAGDASAAWTNCVGTSAANTITIGSWTDPGTGLTNTYCCVQTGAVYGWYLVDSSPITSNPTIYGYAGNDHITVVRANFPVSVGCNNTVTLQGLSYSSNMMTLVGDGPDTSITAGRDVIHGADGPDTIYGDNLSCSTSASYGNDDTIDAYSALNYSAGCGGIDVVLDESGNTGAKLEGGTGDGDCLGVTGTTAYEFDCNNQGGSETADTYADGSPWSAPTTVTIGGTSTCLGANVPSCI